MTVRLYFPHGTELHRVSALCERRDLIRICKTVGAFAWEEVRDE